MNNKKTYILFATLFLALLFVVPSHHNKGQMPTVFPKKETVQRIALKQKRTNNKALERLASKKLTVKKTKPKNSVEKVIIKGGSSNKLALTKVRFEELPGWDKANMNKSLSAFQVSCKTLLKKAPSHQIGSQHIKLKAGDWHPACKAALKLNSNTEEAARAFFEKWFHPLEFEQKKPVHGLFTGYYMPKLEGSLKRTLKYSTPIYGLPQKSLTHFTREQIDNGVLKNKAPVIAWIHSPIDRLFLEIEGSGVIKLPNGKDMYLGYAGENGAPYTSIGKVLINNGVLTKDNASKSAIINYLEKHTDKANSILHKNKSFVFFEHLKKPIATGTNDITLTPGYSLAIDKKWIPLGAPLWLDTKAPDVKHNNEKQFQRLMIAQDTGGAIRGFMRADIYWGSGKLAAFLGENMKHEGHYWLLLPKRFFDRFSRKSYF